MTCDEKIENRGRMHDLFEGLTEEEIREKLEKMPLEDPKVVAETQFFGSGMTAHGFMVGSGDWYRSGPVGDVICDEAGTIYNSVNRWDRNGRIKENV